ncbi:MAG TPA: formate dehydrogenase accessory sulfurtransferase FdhD, partial [Methanocorpusculum sp.]|nr:formate dehydrogenase accessory sulfurtransferase FdhD [Methanocorpusculum sp.]
GLLNEQPVSLTVNGRGLVTVMMLKEMTEEFAAGYLVTEGIVPYTDIESVMRNDSGVSVLTKNPFKVLLPKKSVVSGCGGTASYLDPQKMPVLTTCIPVQKNILREEFCSEVIKAGGFGAKAFANGKLVASAEDIGQYSALDKVVGRLLMDGISPESTAVIVSGKITAELVRKCLFAKISVLASKLPPTHLAAEVAKNGKLTLVF